MQRSVLVRGNVGSLKTDLIKLATYKTYLHGVSDAGTRPFFKFRSGRQGLNEVGIGVEKENRNVLCVALSVRAWCMCCESVRLIVVELVLLKLEEMGMQLLKC